MRDFKFLLRELICTETFLFYNGDMVEFNLTMKLKKKIVNLAGLEEDECLQLLNHSCICWCKEPR
ncbi:hypothetical protein IEQ34_022871 [Dendrobium chrysotoxum]|uniref:Uncharacterized protein n=1 Tax=Dendrobium chrysotoxum TaxID=161865 RepID=A0AAV7FYB5_DENCH|nr:hypothetical protein IEQ34_022871 [Dendrobium chrysotoxum]